MQKKKRKVSRRRATERRSVTYYMSRDFGGHKRWLTKERPELLGNAYNCPGEGLWRPVTDDKSYLGGEVKLDEGEMAEIHVEVTITYFDSKGDYVDKTLI